MDKELNIPSRLHSVATEHVVAEASEIIDETNYDEGVKQTDINEEVILHADKLSNLENRLSAVENLGEISVGGGDIQIANNASDITHGSAKVPTANAVNDALLNVGYFECSTAAATAAKVVSAPGYTLRSGGSIKIKMTVANTANDATLNIGSTGAKALYYNGERASSGNTWEDGETVEVYYDGTSYYANNVAGGNGDGVYDISAVHSGIAYADLAAALGTNGINVPDNVRQGGMSVKFVNNTNEYEQWRYMGTSTANANFVNTDKWKNADYKTELSLKNVANSDLDFSDGNGNVVLRLANGHIQTKYFNSANVSNNYVNVSSISELPVTGNANTIYRVSNWDGYQVNPSKYAEYSWDGSDYLLLNVYGVSETNKDIKILFVGNSLTQDAVSYLPLLLNEIAPDINFKLYCWYNGGITLQNQYIKFLSDANAEVFSIYESEYQHSWTNYENSKNISWVLANCDFDVVVLQEYSYYEFTEANETTYYSNFVNFFKSNYNKSLKFATLIDAPNRSKVESMFALAQQYAGWHLKNTDCQSVISPGAAVYYALQTSLDNLGDSGHLSPDGTHTQEGLPCLLQSYVIAIWIFEQLGVAKSICGSKTVITQAVWDALNSVGPNLGSGIITGTAEQHYIAQSCAIKAAKLAKKIETNIYYNF